jgi:hypothetical protein
MQYRVLVFDPRARNMSVDVLRCIRDLVNAGATVIGAKPQSSPSLADDPGSFQAIADSLWGGPGDNQLQVRVTNTWVNRLIGDKQPGAEHHAFSTFDPYEATSSLLESGLLGPVSLNLLMGASAHVQ